jgi:hypothetical protein
MPILDAAARTIALGSVVGPDRAAIAPDTYTVHLFDDDPALEGVELTATTELDEGTVANGYAAATVNAADFTFDGEIATVLAGFEADNEWSATATHFLMRSGADDWFTGELLEPLDVTAAGAPFQVACSIFIDDAVEPPA